MSRDALAEAQRLLGSLAVADAPLGVRTTYRVGGAAALGVTARTVEDVLAVQRAVRASGVAVLVVGKGSNLLVADEGFAGLALFLDGELGRIAVDDATATVRAGGGAALPQVARQTAAAGWAGMEWAVGIPGTVGGAVRMNAGGHGAAVIDRLERWWAVDLHGQDGEVEKDAAALAAGYRRSAVGAACVVTGAEFRLDRDEPARATARIDEIVRWRRENQPGGQNAGSVFTNPEGDSAGRLVDAAGCKGLRVGSAEVSRKHANFIQADAGGRAADVVALIDEVRRRVRAASGVVLEPELRLAGFAVLPW